jgi:hypothetical protein
LAVALVSAGEKVKVASQKATAIELRVAGFQALFVQLPQMTLGRALLQEGSGDEQRKNE